MVEDRKLTDEPARLAALRRYDVLDTPPEPAFERITALVQAVLSVPIVSVSLIDADRQWFKSCVGFDTPETAREISFCSHAIQSRDTLYVRDATLDERFKHNPLVTGPPFIRTYLGVPLTTPDGYNYGALCAIDNRVRYFDSAQIEVLKSFAAIVMDSMELRRIAQIDFLTGAMTRRGFCLEADKAIARYTRYHRPTVLMAFDIDHFKRINDTYGHPVGDQVLKRASYSIGRQLRTNDVLGRLGGEEFGVLLPDIQLADAEMVAERFRLALHNVIIESEPDIRVTASFGIATADEYSFSAETWLATVDEGLYAAKRNGRDRCFVVNRAQAAL